MLANFEIVIDGVTWEIEVSSYKMVAPWKGNPLDCPSDVDFYGETIFEFDAYSDNETVIYAHNKWNDKYKNLVLSEYKRLLENMPVDPPDF